MKIIGEFYIIKTTTATLQFSAAAVIFVIVADQARYVM
jgi:hypothetical protein